MAKYLYNKYILPKLVWDENSYPYVFIEPSTNKAFALTSPLTCSGAWIRSATPEVPYLRSTLALDENGREYWTDWEVVTESTELTLYGEEWSNHDILTTSGSVYCTATDPTKVSLPVVLFEGDKTTKTDESVNGAGSWLLIATSFAIGDTLRFTIDGVSGEYVTKRRLDYNQAFIGNEWLWDGGQEDNNGDWLFAYDVTKNISTLGASFYTRAEGTYQLKVELIASSAYDEPETAAHDFYIIKNGVGQKQDAYLRIGDKCVKQEEYLA